MDEEEPQARAEELAARIARGDAAAEAELVTRYRPGLLLMFRHRLLGVVEAEDLCQETLRVAIENLRAGRLKKEDRLAAYLWGIAAHLSHRRRGGREIQGIETLAEALDRSPLPDERLMSLERRSLLQGALERLPARDRRVLLDFFFGEKSKEEICRDAGLTPSQFDLIKFRALKRLARLWASVAGESL